MNINLFDYWDVVITAADGSTVSHYAEGFPIGIDPNRLFEQTMQSISWAVNLHGNKFANARVEYIKQDQELINSIKDSVLNDLKSTGYIKAIVHYKDGSFWLWIKDEAYDHRGMIKKEFRLLLSQIEKRFKRGHDSSEKLFKKQKAKSLKIELV